ncbi:MAG: AAA family ATPase [Gammaproteobacteria bacterium]|nr:AAA family ATPase [Gammaproteobacteria bacterium]
MPFKNTPDSRFFFPGAQRGAILDALIYAICGGESMIKVVGEVGSGKTMLCRTLQLRLPDSVEVVYLAHPSLTPDNILHVIANELHLDVRAELNRFEVLSTLQHCLLDRHAMGKQVVILIEEAQNMPLDTLEEVRLLSNLETQQHKLLQIVLFGQPELDQHLGTKSMRQFKERVGYSFDLPPFSISEVRDYLNHRMHVAGSQASDFFPPRVIRRIAGYSQGSIRRINLLADKMLLAAYAQNASQLTMPHLLNAVKDCVFNQQPWRLNRLKRVGYLWPVVVMTVLFALFQSSTLTPQDLGASWRQPLSERLVADAEVGNTNSSTVTKTAIRARTDVLDSGRVTFTKRFAGRGAKILTQRQIETRRWIASVDDSYYTIQLMTRTGTSRAEVEWIEQVLSQSQVAPYLNSIHVHEGVIGGQVVLAVSYGHYAGFSAARSALVELPKLLTRFQPFIRSIRSLENEINER